MEAEKNVTVIIPALNEEKTVARVVEIAKNDLRVLEVIVVDDESADETVEEAEKAGARVVTSKLLGKGASMKDGLDEAKGSVIVYLDADLASLDSKVIELITAPIANGEADFVKASYERKAGRVTELVAKPLLEMFFPELTKFEQPLCGIIAGRKEFFQKISFENDYGVDVGIFLDLFFSGARIKQVNIGKIDHKMKTWRGLKGMSFQVARAILKRARKLKRWTLEDISEIDLMEGEFEDALEKTMRETEKLAVFDMDGTLLEGRSILAIAEKFGFTKQAEELLESKEERFIKTKKIASLLKGLKTEDVLKAIDEMPLTKNAAQTIEELKKRGYKIGIVSDSYQIIAEHVKNKVGADFALANELETKNGVFTGEVKIPSAWLSMQGEGCKTHSVCKLNVLIELAKKSNLNLKDCIAIGDNEGDACMIREAGIGIAFNPKTKQLKNSADAVIEEKDLSKILEYC